MNRGGPPGGVRTFVVYGLAVIGLAVIGIVVLGSVGFGLGIIGSGVIGLLAFTLTVVVIAAARTPACRDLAAAFARRQPGQAVLMLAAVALGATILSASAVMTDTVVASIDARRERQQGPIDTVVLARSPTATAALDALAASTPVDPAAVLSLTFATAAVTSGGFIGLEEPRAQIVEVDFAQAAAFGDDPARVGISGPTPPAGEAVANADLAARLNLSAGSRVVIHAYGATEPVRINRVIATQGLAGLLSFDGPASSRAPDLFVAPGTLDRMHATAPATPAATTPPPARALAFSRPPPPLASPLASPLEVRAIARENTADTDRLAGAFDRAIAPFVLAGVATGLLLLVLTIAIACDRQRRVLAELHAIGLDRRGLVTFISIESAGLSGAGAIVGTILGIGMARLGTAAAGPVFAPETADTVLFLSFHVTAPTVLRCAAAATLLGIITATLVAGVATRGSLAPALTGQPSATRSPGRMVASRLPARSVVLDLALAYPRWRPGRTAALVAMFAITVAGATAPLVIDRSHEADAIESVADLGGAAGVLVTTNPSARLTADELARDPDVAWAVEARTRSASLTADGITSPVRLVGVAAALADRGAPMLVERSADIPTDLATWQATLASSDAVIVGADLAADASGLHSRQIRVGDRVVLTDARTGRTREVRVVGIARRAQYAGDDHVYGSTSLARDLGGEAAPDRFFVAAAGVDDGRLATDLLRRHRTEVVDSSSFNQLAGDRVHQRRDFLHLLVGFGAIGLLAGTLACGVVFASGIADRRVDLGVLRALGADDHTVRRVLRTEATVVTGVGALVGIGAGLVIAWLLLSTAAAGFGPSLAIPWLPLGALAALSIAGARAAVWVATTISLGTEPAAALAG